MARCDAVLRGDGLAAGCAETYAPARVGSIMQNPACSMHEQTGRFRSSTNSVDRTIHAQFLVGLEVSVAAGKPALFSSRSSSA